MEIYDSEEIVLEHLKAVRRYISQNRRHFRAGREVTLSQVLAHFDIVEPTYEGMTVQQTISANRHFLNKRTKLTRRFNDILAERGMYLRKKKNEDAWLICETEQVVHKVERLGENSTFTRQTGTIMTKGLAEHNNNYSYVDNASLKRIAHRVTNR